MKLLFPFSFSTFNRPLTKFISIFLTSVLISSIHANAVNVVKSGESKGGKVHLEIRELRPGSYFLHIIYDKEIIREQILV